MTFSQVRNYVKELIKSLGLTPVEELSSSDIQDLKDAFDASNSSVINPLTPGFTPIGTIISVMGNTAPPNYLICNGQTVNISDYPELANYFEQQFGTKNNFGGDGTTTFAVPDLRGEFLRGSGTNSHTNQGSGANVGIHQDATKNQAGSTNKVSALIVPESIFDKTDTSLNLDSVLESTGIRYISTSSVNTVDNRGVVYASRPTNTSVLYCIAVRNIFIEQIKSENIYSLDEKIVGQWIDGKPIYQRTINFSKAFSSYSSARYCSYETDIENVDCVINHNGYFFLSSSSETVKKVIGDSDMDWNIKPGYSSQVTLAPSGKLIISCVYQSSNYNSTNFEGVVTLQYTKTTD